jgi:hypothetical protein
VHTNLAKNIGKSLAIRAGVCDAAGRGRRAPITPLQARIFSQTCLIVRVALLERNAARRHPLEKDMLLNGRSRKHSDQRGGNHRAGAVGRRRDKRSQ